MEQVAPTEASDGVAIEFGFRHLLHHLGPVAAVHHLVRSSFWPMRDVPHWGREKPFGDNLPQ
jgi:hypothetical protein